MHKADNLPPSGAIATKCGNLNFLETSGPVKACNGTALPFTFVVPWLYVWTTVCKKIVCFSLYSDTFVAPLLYAWTTACKKSQHAEIYVQIPSWYHLLYVWSTVFEKFRFSSVYVQMHIIMVLPP